MAGTYQDLIIWQKAISFARDIYKLTGRFPKEEQYGLISQLQRAAVSISSNIAEGSGRGSRADFCRFIDIATGSLNEVESLLAVSKELGHIEEPKYREMLNDAALLGKSIVAFKKHLKR